MTDTRHQGGNFGDARIERGLIRERAKELLGQRAVLVVSDHGASYDPPGRPNAPFTHRLIHPPLPLDPYKEPAARQLPITVEGEIKSVSDEPVETRGYFQLPEAKAYEIRLLGAVVTDAQGVVTEFDQLYLRDDVVAPGSIRPTGQMPEAA